ncbi:MAG: ATP-binding protein [Candidatus Faecousia sp.]|nr:ATP-binding protein [Candidatus Faecousia sp.]
MNKRIFRGISLTALVVLLLSMVIIFGALYGYFDNLEASRLRTETALAVQGVRLSGSAYFEDLEPGDYRLTWVAEDGRVLADTETDPAAMENHASRQEIAQALKNGYGESRRYSDTRMEKTLYYALRLEDGSVVRLSVATSTVLNLVLGMAQPICLVLAGALVMSLILAGRISKKIVAPLNALDLEHPLDNEGYDELSPLLRRLDVQQQQIRSRTAELKRRQADFAAVTDSMGEGLVLLDQEDAVLSINPAACRLLECTATIGRDILEVNRSPELRAVLARAHEGRRAEELISIRGSKYRLEGTPVKSSGVVRGVVLLFQDVTEREQAERIRREFTANVSHELKTPLHAISGYAELLSAGMVKSEDMPRFAGNIYTEAQRLILLVEDIIRLSQLDEGAAGMGREQVNLAQLVRETVRSLDSMASEAQVTVATELENVSVNGIEQLLSGVVYNLADNAIKYNHPGGTVTIRLRERGEQAILQVADTGVGIPEESRERIFERFYRVDKSRSKAVGGTGLGLSIVKHAVMIHRGTIHVDSTLGKGTTITVTLPKDSE